MATREQLIEDFADHKYATGEKFERLINSMKAVQEPVADPAASGTSLSFIDSIEQDKDGKITATKKTLDLSNAHELNPFKGWYKTGDTLPTDGFDGAYLYFKDTSELTGQTTIYRWNGTTYADTGTVVDTSNVQTFGSGQAVNAVKIKDASGQEVTGSADVLSAEAGGRLNGAVNDIYHRSVTPASETVIFSGTSGYATFDAVTLSQEGDYLEVEIKAGNNLAMNNGGFAFLTNGSSQAVAIAGYLISVKNSSHAWLNGMNGANGQLSTSPSVLSGGINKIKLAWEATGFAVYLNDELIHTISGALPTVAFNGIGRYLWDSEAYHYWRGELYSFKVKAGNTEIGKLSSLTNFDNQGLTINTGQEVVEESGKLMDVKEELQQQIAGNSAVFHSGQRVSGVDIVNDFESGGTNNVLSAEMGKELNQKIEGELGVRTLNSLVIAEGGEISFDEITLSEDGDSLEFDVTTLVEGAQNLKARAFAGYSDSKYSILLHAYMLGLVSGTTPITNFNGGSGQYNFGSIVNILTSHATFKIAFENSAINLYINGTLRQSSTDVRPIRINRIGGPYTNSGTTYHWAGTLYSFNYTHAGVTKSIIDLNGYQVNNLVTENITQEVLSDGLEQRVSLIEKVTTEKGKKIGWFGDSLSMIGKLPHIVGALLGADVYDFSISGSSATKTVSGANQTNVTVQALIEQKIAGDLSDARTDIENQGLGPSTKAAKLENIANLENANFEELDKIVIFSGTNDLGKQYLTIENFKTGLRAIFTTLLSEWPNLQIVWISPAWRSDANTPHPNTFVLQDICDAIEDVCKEYSVPFMDFYHQCMVNSVNALTYMTNENPIIHPNDAGDKMWGMKIARYIASK